MVFKCQEKSDLIVGEYAGGTVRPVLNSHQSVFFKCQEISDLIVGECAGGSQASVNKSTKLDIKNVKKN